MLTGLHPHQSGVGVLTYDSGCVGGTIHTLIHINRCLLRTNIVMDDELVTEAMKLADIRTKREVVDAALREFVAHRKRLDLRDLKGSGILRSDYDYKGLRGGTGER